MEAVEPRVVRAGLCFLGLALSWTLASAAAQDGVLGEARALYRQLQDQKVIELLEPYLQQHPADGAARPLHARCLKNLGRFAEAVDSLQQLADPKLKARVMHAECLARTGNLKDAFSVLLALSPDEKSSTDGRVGQLRVLLASVDLGNQEVLGQAVAVLQELQQSQPKLGDKRLPVAGKRHPDADLVMAQVLARIGRLPEAEELAQALLEDPDHYPPFDPHLQLEAKAVRAQVFLARGDLQQSVDLLQEVLKRLPDRASLHFALAGSLYRLHKYKDSVHHFEQAADLAPGNSNYTLGLAEIYRSQRQVDAAINQFESASKIFENPSVPSLSLAELYLEKRDLEKAAAAIETALAGVPPMLRTSALEVAGRIREKQGDKKAAEQAYRECLRSDQEGGDLFDPLRYDAIYRLGLLLVRSAEKERRDEGRQLLDRYQRVQPFLEAITQTQSSLQYSPADPKLYAVLAAWLNRGGEYQQATVFIRESLRLARNDPSCYAMAGFIAANSGDNDAALRYFEETQRLLPRPDPQLQTYIQQLLDGQQLPLPLVPDS
jgi:tetratricopeptide (TPR) repeat protein